MKQSEGGGGDFQPVHQWMRAGATCVASPRDSSAATAHVCLGSNRGSLSPSPPPSSFKKKNKTALHWLPSAVAMALGCSGNWRTQLQREKPWASCHLNWGRKDTIISFSNRLASCVLAVKNNIHKQPVYLILLWDADNEQAHEFSTMAAVAARQETKDTKEEAGGDNRDNGD